MIMANCMRLQTWRSKCWKRGICVAYVYLASIALLPDNWINNCELKFHWNKKFVVWVVLYLEHNSTKYKLYKPHFTGTLVVTLRESNACSAFTSQACPSFALHVFASTARSAERKGRRHGKKPCCHLTIPPKC